MPKVKMVEASIEQKEALEKGAKYGSTPSFRLRCHAILLKCEKRTSLAVANELGCCEMSVQRLDEAFRRARRGWPESGQGPWSQRHSTKTQRLGAIRRAVQNSRQRISLAKAELEEELGKKFSQLTLRRFLKRTVAATNALDG